MSGKTGAMAMVSQKPARRVSFSLAGANLIIRMPAMPKRNMRTMVMMRDLWMLDVASAEMKTAKSWKAEAGRPMRMVWYSS